MANNCEMPKIKMKIAVASGKGGTGKTTVSTNLALAAASQGISSAYMDCDVEEPNGALFLKPEIEEKLPVKVNIPEADSKKCIKCGKCAEICQFNAITIVGGNVMVFPELCHGCAGCWLVCPAGAIRETQRITGTVEKGRAGKVLFAQGLLNIGEVMSPPVIAEVKKNAPDAEFVIIDSPPGTSCPVIESVRGNDYILLVTEPTPFGLNDLKLAVDMCKALKQPFGVAINRCDSGDGETIKFCHANNIEILAEIPDDRRVAEAYSRGKTAFNAIPEYASIFKELLNKIKSNIENAVTESEAAK